MDLTCHHQVHEIVLICIITIVLILFLLIWLYELCSWMYNSLCLWFQQQQGINNETANDPEIGSVDNIHELFLRLWEDLGLWVQPQTLRNQRKKAIEKFPPPEKYEIDNRKMSATGATGCAICLEEFVDGDLFRVLPVCKHVYHSECINRWFLIDEMRCPICRSSI